MKVFLLALFVAAAVAVPIPEEEEIGDPVELIVNGVPEGESLDLGDVLSVKVKQHVDGQLASATDLLYPLTAQGMAEAAAALPSIPKGEDPEVLPEGVVLPEAPAPEVVPEAVILPEPALPEVDVPEAVILPEPALPEVDVPEAVILPEPALPEVNVPEAVILPEPALPEVVVPEIVFEPEIVSPEVVPENVQEPQIAGEVYNDGFVQVKVNAVLSTVKSLVSMVMNYFNGDVQTTQQII